jgi:alanine racemase
MSNLQLSLFSKWTKGVYVQSGQDDKIEEILFDTRKLIHPKKVLFIAIATTRNDPNRFIPELINKGVVNFITSKYPDSAIKDKANFLVVENPVMALQEIALNYRKNFQYPIIGITGSNGKTIVKEWLNDALKNTFRITRSPRSFNSQMGVPLSLLRLNEHSNLAIIEAGISAPGEMQRLEKIIKPDIGIFTNIGSAHSENFTDLNQKIKDKAILFKGVKQIIYCRDHEEIHLELSKIQGKQFSWGKHPEAIIRILEIKSLHELTSIKCEYQGLDFTIETKLSGNASIENLMHVVAALLALEITIDKLNSHISHIQPIEMRMEIKKGIHNCILINDTWSLDNESIQASLDVLLQQKKHTNRTVILSDFADSEHQTNQNYEKIAEMLSLSGVTRLIGVGENLIANASLFVMEKLFFVHTNDLLKELSSIHFKDEVILIKGARKFHFEDIADSLQEKSHATVLEINLTNLIDNLNVFRNNLPAGIQTMAMVKAYSYGSGSYEIANALQMSGVDYLSVAYSDEGVELRKAGIFLPIMVMNPEPDSFKDMIEFRLEPEIYSFRILHAYAKAVSVYNRNEQKTNPIHIKFDTGMHRLGFLPNETALLAKALINYPELTVATAFSHLVASSNPDFDEFTCQQIEDFQHCTNELMRLLQKKILRHILNSGGIQRHPNGFFDMIRLGIGLYGIDDKSKNGQLKCVHRLKTSISQIKNINPPETVGYNRKGKVLRPSKIATIPLGYADGFRRTLGNGKGLVKIQNKFFPTIGDICMDMCMIDITDLENVSEGDEVIIFENQTDVLRLSEQMQTIPYELFTSISSRVKRVYLND